jgi:hypothetical protein
MHAMKVFCFSGFLWVLGLAAMFSLAFPQNAISASFNGDSDSPSLPASMTGVLFYDKEHDGELDQGSELAFSGVTIELYQDNSTTPLETTTNKTGQFTFDNLTPGTYRLSNNLVANWLPVAGDIIDVNGKPKLTGLGISDVTTDEITTISLAGGDSAFMYNFAAQAYPIQLLSKRMLLASSAGAIIHAVPEPSTLVMLIGAAFAMGIGALSRRRS